MGEWYRRFSIAVAVLGTIGVCALTYYYGHFTDPDSSWFLALEIFACGMAIVITLSAILYAIYEIMLNLEAIVEIQDASSVDIHRIRQDLGKEKHPEGQTETCS